MAATLATLGIMAMLGFLVVFGGYIIIVGDREEAERKRAKKAKSSAT